MQRLASEPLFWQVVDHSRRANCVVYVRMVSESWPFIDNKVYVINASCTDNQIRLTLGGERSLRRLTTDNNTLYYIHSSQSQTIN